LLGGRVNATATPERSAKGQMSQNKPRQVEVWMNAAAKNGPMLFPNPTCNSSWGQQFPNLNGSGEYREELALRSVGGRLSLLWSLAK
jgi:hypothetical protein